MKRLYLDMETSKRFMSEELNKERFVLNEIIKDHTLSLKANDGIDNFKVRVYEECIGNDNLSYDRLISGSDDVREILFTKTLSGDYIFYGLSIIHPIVLNREKQLRDRPIELITLTNENELTLDMNRRYIIMNYNDEENTIDIIISCEARVITLNKYTKKLIKVF